MLVVGQSSCWPQIRFISNRMKVERVILEGLKKGGPIDDGQRVPDPTHEQQAQEALLRARRRPGTEDNASSPDENHLSATRSPTRRHSTSIQALTRQASVLWNDHEETEGEEDQVTTDGEGDDDEHITSQSPMAMHDGEE